ncbi:MAG: thioredoxin domain-containing protein [Proteobacteria bacterium]|nr:thioredoxin domain-containing protein [Pseudomonadota bacterium]
MSDSAVSETNVPKSKGLWIAAAFVAVVGLGLSIYSVVHHLELRANGHTDAICNVNSQINCDALGAGYFLAMIFLAVTTAQGHKTRREHEPAWFLLVAAGVLVSIGLGIISLGVIGKVCLICIGTYVCTLVQGGLAYALYRDGDKRQFEVKLMGNGLTTAAVALALAVVGFNFAKPSAELPVELQDVAGKHDAAAKSTLLLPIVKEIPINRTAYSGTGEDYRLGSDEAKVTVVEFADYQCPACADAKKTIDELHQAMGDKILIVFKNYPLSNKCNANVQSDMHPFSCDIARLARCAGQYGKFWEYHRKAFDEQKSASLEKAKEWGKSVGLTEAQMQACLSSADILTKLQDDVNIGNTSGLDGTPTIFINGRKYLGGRTVSELRSAIESLF